MSDVCLPSKPCGALPRGLVRLGLAGLLAVLAACSSAPRKPVSVAPPPVPVAQPAPPAAPQPEPEPTQAQPHPGKVSSAATPREYRPYGASHIYAQNADRIFAGKLPPLLYAVGVLNVDIDDMGQVQRLDWMRAPRHAPEVMAEIERMVRAAAPFPAPARMGRVTWTDTWLWDRSGRFQIDTLTEGQLGQLSPAPAAPAAPPRRRASR